jgi:imidazolonepropionase-like amidohydrolase
LETLISATRRPAEFFGLQNSLGTIERGKIADLVLLEADPLVDIKNTRRIGAVVVNGNYMSREAIQRMLNEVRVAAGN